jgi:hypothetical protein
MRIVRKGKEYDYDYKTVYLHGKQHRPLQDLAKKHKVSMGEMIIKLIRNYEKNNKNYDGTTFI